MRWVAQEEEEEEDRAVLFLQHFWRFRNRPQAPRVTLPTVVTSYPISVGLIMFSSMNAAVEWLHRNEAWPITSYRRYE
jgi:hypothetical protein